jgi:hypothetical protein
VEPASFLNAYPAADNNIPISGEMTIEVVPQHSTKLFPEKKVSKRRTKKWRR